MCETMAKLTFRFTFIDVVEEEAKPRPRPRSVSPSRAWAPVAEPEAKAGDAAAWRQLRALQKGVDAIDEPTDAVLSVGSIGHPDFCKRPCVHVVKLKGGKCRKQSRCGFCHHPFHNDPRPDKRQRALMKTMSKAELLDLVAHELQERIQRDMIHDAQTLLAVPGLKNSPVSFRKPWYLGMKVNLPIGRQEPQDYKLHAKLPSWAQSSNLQKNEEVEKCIYRLMIIE